MVARGRVGSDIGKTCPCILREDERRQGRLSLPSARLVARKTWLLLVEEPEGRDVRAMRQGYEGVLLSE